MSEIKVFHVLPSAEIFELLNSLTKENPILAKVWQFTFLIIFVNDPNLIKNVLTAEVCLEKPSIFYKFIHADNGLTAARCK